MGKHLAHWALALVCAMAFSLTRAVQAADAGAAEQVGRAVAVLHPTEGNKAHGIVKFTKETDGVRVSIEVRGLEPNSTHAIHVHQYGDCTAPDASSAGGHYNPGGHEHHLPDISPRHAGDLGNITADAEGVAKKELTVQNITVAGEMNPVIGRGVIVHAKPDTGKGESGEAGARIACGVIGVANPSSK